MNKLFSGGVAALLVAVILVGLWLGTNGKGGWGQPASAEPGPRRLAEVFAFAKALHLNCESDPPNVWPVSRVILSQRNDIPKFLPRLNLPESNFSSWKDTVGIYKEDASDLSMFQTNLNPVHPDRYAQWGRLFVYGDPRLIRKLSSAWAKSHPPE